MTDHEGWACSLGNTETTTTDPQEIMQARTEGAGGEIYHASLSLGSLPFHPLHHNIQKHRKVSAFGECMYYVRACTRGPRSTPAPSSPPPPTVRCHLGVGLKHKEDHC